MKTMEVEATDGMIVELHAATEELDEVMVVAYGTAKKESFTGSAAVVNNEQIEKRQVSNLTKALDGLAPGIQTTSGSGQPGSGSNIYIRGIGSINASSTPLYVLDGVPYDGSLSSLNPSDIEQISILKDASATALYGARGANGVVMITTKKGTKDGMEVNLKASVGTSSRSIPRYDTMGPKEYIESVYSAFYNAQIANGVSPDQAGALALAEMASGAQKIFGENEQYNPYNYKISELINTSTGLVRDDAKLLWNEDWLEQVTNKYALRQEYVASISGGKDKTQYMFSLGYVDEEGVLKTTNYERYSAMANIETKPKEWFGAGFGTNFSQGKSNTAASEGSGATSNVWYSAQLMAPIFPVYILDRNGEYVLDADGQKQFDYGVNRPAGQQQNFNSIATLYDDKYSSEVNNLSARTHFDFGDMKTGWHQGIKFQLNFGLDYYNANTMVYYNPYFGNAASSNGRLQKQNTGSLGYTFNQILSYNRKFGDHTIDILAGHEWYAYKSHVLYAEKTGFPFGGLYELDAASTVGSIIGYSDQYNIESYFGRLNYNYKDKYYLSGSFRLDASSRFYKDNRWGNFWSVGANYRISQEDFMSSTTWLDNLAIRASYGVQGNDDLLTYYAWQSMYNLTYSNASEAGAIVTSVANKDVTWESNHNFNIGLDASLWKRLEVAVEWYNRKTTNMLLAYPLALSTGFEGYNRNSGTMRNRGLETTITGIPIKRRNFEWKITWMGSTINNKVLKLTDDGKDILNGYSLIREGETIYSYYVCRSAGVDPMTGDQLYYVTIDEDGNEVAPYITNNEQLAQSSRYVAGSKLPDLYGSLTNQLTFRNFDFSLSLNYSIGGKMVDGVYQNLMSFYYPAQTKHINYSRAWKQIGDITDIPRYEIGKTYPTTDDMLITASYLSIKNATLGYTFSSKLFGESGIKSLRLALTGDNLYMFTALKGMDPQYSLTGGTNYVYAPTRTVSFTVDLKF